MPQLLFAADDRPNESRHDGRVLTGRAVLAILLGFFLTVGAANAIMISYALSTFRGEVGDHPYEAGLAFNSEIAAARAQEARNWSFEVALPRDGRARRLDVSARDAEGRPLAGLRVTATFAAPVDARLDRRVDLGEAAAGHYTGEVPVAAGHWDLEIAASRDGATLFQSRNRILVE